MRPRQWAKNLFIFVGIVFDKQILNFESMSRVLIAFVLLSLTASAIYVINDIVDVERDRLHPKKRERPIASGRLPIRIAQIVAVILPVVGIGGAFLISRGLAIVLIVYFLLHILYSFALKRVIIIDIFAIAAGFVLRVVAGVVVVNVQNFSPWLYAFTGLLALFLAVGKRRQELVLLDDDAASHRSVYKQYNLSYLDELLRLTVISTGIMYTLYAVEAETVLTQFPSLMLFTVPFVYYALFRYLYLIYVKGEGGDPTEVLFVDRPLQVSIVMYGAVVFSVLYVI